MVCFPACFGLQLLGCFRVWDIFGNGGQIVCS